MADKKDSVPDITHIQASLLLDLNKRVKGRLFGLPDFEQLEKLGLIKSDDDQFVITELGKQTCEALACNPEYSFLQ